MATYIILSRISPHAFDDPDGFKKLADAVSEKIKTQCPAVKWKESFVTMGRFDVVDIVESDDPQQVGRAAMLIRAYGKSETETMPATEWKSFLKAL
ncbi:MAG: GYD domain-containing protein [Desulfomonilaceae bacterium]|nr:GYD domain-containing protein [Desulfomonilaceae bacterium]